MGPRFGITWDPHNIMRIAKRSRSFNKTASYKKKSKRERTSHAMSKFFRPISANQTYSFQHTVVSGGIPVDFGSGGTTGFLLGGTTTATANFGLKMSFQPNGFALTNANGGLGAYTTNNGGTIAALFEQVRLRNVQVKAFWSNNAAIYANSTNIANATCNPILQCVSDFDQNVSVPANSTVIADYPGKQMKQVGTAANNSKDGSFLTHRLIPRASIENNSVSYQQLMPIDTWMSTQNGGNNVNYYGLLFFLDTMGFGSYPASGTFAGSIEFYVTLTLEYKGCI